MRLGTCFNWTIAAVVGCGLTVSGPIGAQGSAQPGSMKEGSVVTKEALFDGAGLSSDQQNKVLGNLIKHYQLGATKPFGAAKGAGANAQGMFDSPGPLDHRKISYQPPDPNPLWKDGNAAPSDRCAIAVDEQQLNALQRMLVAALAAQAGAGEKFTAKIPKACKAEELRYYLRVAAQLYPEGKK